MFLTIKYYLSNLLPTDLIFMRVILMLGCRMKARIVYIESEKAKKINAILTAEAEFKENDIIRSNEQSFERKAY